MICPEIDWIDPAAGPEEAIAVKRRPAITLNAVRASLDEIIIAGTFPEDERGVHALLDEFGYEAMSRVSWDRTSDALANDRWGVALVWAWDISAERVVKVPIVGLELYRELA